MGWGKDRMNKPYCGTCNAYNIPVINGICQGCGTDYFDDLANIKKSLKAVKFCKAQGWKQYPNPGFMPSEPIDEVIGRLESEIKALTSNSND